MPEQAANWERVKEIVGLALEARGEARSTLIADACAGDAALRKEVESLLQYSGHTGVLDRVVSETVHHAIAANAAPPWRIGPYRIERELGSGGMGTVYLGIREDDQFPARVAIKVTQRGGEALLERFKHERRILAGLIHPYIARMLDAGMLEDGRPYFVMEYVDGRPIDEFVEQVRPAVLELFLKVCAAVQFAHQNLVIHRDLKPGNILVTETGDPRLLDFGIAKLMAGADVIQSDETRPWERMLTPSSASPEQVAGGAITIASDVYSLGVLLYRLLTGVSPYAGAPDFNVDPARAIREYEPPPASSTARLGPRERRMLLGDLDNILRKALEKEPSRRYGTVQELAADIERHLKGLPIEARPASFSYRAAKFIRRNRVAAAAAGLLALSVSGGLVASLQYAHRAHLEQLRSQREFGALRKLTHSFLFEIDDAIHELPGATAVHELVVRRAEEYLDQLSKEAGDDTVVLNDLAESYTRIAQLLGGSRHARGDMSPRRGLENGLKALAIRRHLAALSPGDTRLAVELQDSLYAVASSYATLGDFTRSLDLLTEQMHLSEQAWERNRVPDAGYMLGTSLTGISDCQRTLGRYDEAVDSARRSLAVRQQLLQSDPSSMRARRVVGISYEYIGYALFWQGNYAAAAEQHRAALEQFEPVARIDSRQRRLVADAHGGQCESLAHAGETREALPHCEAAVAIYGGMAEADSGNVQAREDLASAESALSLALDRAHSMRRALEAQQRARRLFVAALAHDPDSLDLAEDNAKSLIELASIQQQLHAAGEAAEAAEEARNTLRSLTQRFPQSHAFVVLLKQAEDISER